MRLLNITYAIILAFLTACTGGTTETQVEGEKESNSEVANDKVSENKSKYAEGKYYAIPTSAYPKQGLSLLPDEATVGIPSYPGAYLLSHATSNDLLPGLVIVSTDPIDQVHSFYKEKLSGWVYDKRVGLFWPGPGAYKLTEHTGKVSSVSLMEWISDSYWSEHLPENVKTQISIIYEPKN